MHGLHIKIFNCMVIFKNLFRMVDIDLQLAGFIELRTIPLSFLQISDLCTVPTRFYESLNEQNQMCELCTFPKSD